MKSVLRYFKLSHVLFASLFWCIGVFLFAGNAFGHFEKVFERLTRTRYETVLTHIKNTTQLEIDKGTSLLQVRLLPVWLARFAAGDPNVLSAFVFNLSSGKILFSSLGAQAGVKVPSDWLAKCDRADTFFTQDFDGKKMISLPVSDSANTVAGCVSVEYKTDAVRVAKEKIIARTIRFAAYLCLAGTALLFGLFFLTYVAVRPNAAHRKCKIVGLSAGVVSAMLLIAAGVARLNDGFYAAVQPALMMKTKSLAGILQANAEKAVQNGIPLKSLVQADSFLENVKRQNREIEFILITDESGRVLYEGGSASAAFEADEHTGRVRLRDGFLNVAEPLRGRTGTVGWVQIGVKKGGGDD